MTAPDSETPAVHRLERLARGCAKAVRLDGGSVAVVSRGEARMVVCATDAVARALEDAQAALGEGPGVEAARSGRPQGAPDLADPGSAAVRRWPFFARQAQALDVRAFFSVPISVRERPLGTLGLYRHAPGALDTHQVAATLAAADQIAGVLLDAEAWSPDGEVHGARMVAPTAQVHQAAGMVMVQLGGTIEEAMAVLRATAYAEDRPLADLAREVVQHRRDLGKGSHHD